MLRIFVIFILIIFLSSPTKIMAGGIVSDFLPKYKLEIEISDFQFLEMSDANFGSFDIDKFAIYTRLQFENSNIAAAEYILSKMGVTYGVNNHFFLRRQTNERIRFEVFEGGSCPDMFCPSEGIDFYASTAILNDTNVHSIYMTYDYAASPRMRMWVDGVEDTPNNYGEAIISSPNDSADPIDIGGIVGGRSYDGTIGMMLFFQGSFPDITDIENADTSLKDVRFITGLKSMWWGGAGDPTEDLILSTAWTNNGNCVVTQGTLETY